MIILVNFFGVWANMSLVQLFMSKGDVEISFKIIRRNNDKAIVLIHGNMLSSDIWIPIINLLPDGYDIIAPDLRGFGDSSKVTIDATKGLHDFSEDLIFLMKNLNYKEYVLMGHSLGGGVALQILLEKPSSIAIRQIILVAPMSPFGFGGTKDERGTPCYPDYAGSGGGLIARYNTEFPRLLKEKYKGTEHPSSPINAVKTLFANDYNPTNDLLEFILNMMFKMNLNQEFYPGDYLESPNWPYVAPGKVGVLNAMSPKYLRLHEIVHLDNKPQITWIHGEKDMIVSDASSLDIAVLGLYGYIPGYPGQEVYPMQPMIKQIQYVLESYADKKGNYEKYFIKEAGHTPFIERPDEFVKIVNNAL